MNVQHKQEETAGLFFIAENGTNIAEMEYSRSGGAIMTITHTEVNEAYRGRNLGVLLVEAGVEFARSKQFKIKPHCSYANAIIRKNERMKDVL